jgi:hypothetical protein
MGFLFVCRKYKFLSTFNIYLFLTFHRSRAVSAILFLHMSPLFYAVA